MDKELKDGLTKSWLDFKTNGVASWGMYPVSTVNVTLDRYLNKRFKNQIAKGIIFRPRSACHANLKPFHFEQEDPVKGSWGEWWNNNGELKYTRVYTSLGIMWSRQKDRNYVNKCQEYFEFILDTEISPWRSILKASNALVYSVNKVEGDERYKIERRHMEKVWSHVSLRMGGRWAQPVAFYNFFIASRMAIDRPEWVESWYRYVHEYDMAPEDAFWMTQRYLFNKASEGARFKPRDAYMHQVSNKGPEASLTVARDGVITTARKDQNTAHRCWTTPASSWPTDRSARCVSGYCNYDNDKMAEECKCGHMPLSGSKPETSPLMRHVQAPSGPREDDDFAEIEACNLSKRRRA